ncbi:restriction endonuclease subunit S [Vibrio tritonius]|uniref:Restriction endonuclease subunit S n=1 Tax=Vibrio tritonius TaxID=1435069 RepID=A0ABS7YQ30_9VIBR|nr:restriction endonuclease subunit S [Vibrio tritonius]MCA2017777.1 restriction endonuclease subunit S [Vibrio tritonius]
MSWPMVEIGGLVTKIDTWNPAKQGGKTPFDYIDLSSVDKDSKKIVSESLAKVVPDKAPSRARQLVKEDDVLVATVRPNLNGVAVVEAEFSGATASTGYCILRVNPKLLDYRYLFYWVQSPLFITDMMSKASGANYPAVSDKIIKESKIPHPPLAEQKRIAAILDKADAIRQKRQQAIKLADEFLRSVFLEMFGDPVTNPKGWGVKELGDVTVKITDGVHSKPQYVDSGVPFISVKDITTGTLNFNDTKFITEDAHQKYIKRCNPEFHDILYTKVGATYGRPAIIETENQFSLYVSVALIKPNHKLINAYFLKEVLATSAIKRQADRSIKGAGVPDLHLVEIRKFIIPVPDMNTQREYVNKTSSIRRKIIRLNESLKLIEEGFNSLSQKAFSGQL